jgi:integrase
MKQKTALTTNIPPAQPISSYGDDMRTASERAEYYRQRTSDVFAEYHDTNAPNTCDRQRFDLLSFCTYLENAGVQRTVDQLYHVATAWSGIREPLVYGYRAWLREEGYAVGTINMRLATIRAYCELACKAGAISEEDYKLIKTVKGYSYKEGRNLDAARERQGRPTRKSTKKAMPTHVTTAQALQLKKTTTQINRQRRTRDISLPTKDALMMCLFIEHALRVSELVSLNIENFDQSAGTVAIYSLKKKEWITHRLKKHSRLALDLYLAEEKRAVGALFCGYQTANKPDARITRYGVYDRVRLLGELLGIDHLSPHDLRHFWTIDALANETPIDRVQAGGNWTTPHMVLRYAKRSGIANEGVKITEE